MIEKGRLGVLSSFIYFNIPRKWNISLAHSANITLTKSKYHISPQAKSYLWGLVKFHIGGKVRARLLNG